MKKILSNKDKARIFLINPSELYKQSALYPPLGLAQISALLKKAGYRPRVIDLLFDKNLKQIKKLKVSNGLYIISFSAALIDRVKKIINIIRKNDKYAFILGGGPHPTGYKEKTFEDLDLNLIAVGEADIVSIVNALQDSNPFPKLKKIRGIMYKYNSKIYVNKPIIQYRDLDELPIPDQGAFPLDSYFNLKGYRELSVTSSRGCPHRCVFCQPTLINLFGKKIRFTSPKRIVDEVEYLVRNFKLDFIVFSDDTFTSDQDRVIKICKEIIRRKIPVLWRCQTHVNLQKDVLKWMKKAGCFLIAFGVESGSQKILNNIDKGTTVNTIINTFKACKEIGILTHAYLMVGNIGESKETINETVKLIKKIKPFSYNVSITTPYPGSYLYEYAKANNLIINQELSEYDHILNNPVAKLSDFEPNELLKLKIYLEKICNKNSERIKDLIILVKDKDFIYRILNILKRNPTMPLRMLRLVIRIFIKKGQGLRVLNPKTGA